MNLSLKRIREVFPHFNKRPVTEAEFWAVCKRERVIVKQLPLAVNGYYEMRKGKHYILINSRLTGIRWLHTAFHEFCHYLFHAPMHSGSTALFKRGQESDEDSLERLADAFAVVCLIPFPDLIKLAHEPIEDPLLLNIAGARVAVLSEMGW